MFLVTAHRKIVALDAGANLIQASPTSELRHTFLSVSDLRKEGVPEEGPLSAYRVQRAASGVRFVRHGQFLCAEPGRSELVADRFEPGLWETFQLLEEDQLETLQVPPLTQEDEIGRFAAAVEGARKAGRPVKIYCGCGPIPRENYLNLDVTVMNEEFMRLHPDKYFIFPYADVPWGLADNIVDYIFHEDFLEHVSQQQQVQFMAEAWRVLKPGGYQRVNTPNWLTAMKLNSDFRLGLAGVYTGEQQWGHVAMLTPASLREMAELVGFREIVFTRKSEGLSPFADPDFRPGADRDDATGNIYADLQK